MMKNKEMGVDSGRERNQKPVGAQPPKGKPNVGSAGPEKKADMSGALMGKPTDKNPLAGAVQELGRQHPERYDDHGPHHGGNSHIRHEPLAGMKPRSGG